MDVTYLLVRRSDGLVTGAVDGAPDASADTDVVERTGPAADAWIGWQRQVDGSYASAPQAAVDLKAYAVEARWHREVAGTTWAASDGTALPVATDDRSKTLVNGELSAIALSVRVDGEPFKFADGIMRPLSNAELQAVAIAMREHVKRTFGALFAVMSGISDGSITTVAQVDAVIAAA